MGSTDPDIGQSRAIVGSHHLCVVKPRACTHHQRQLGKLNPRCLLLGPGGMPDTEQPESTAALGEGRVALHQERREASHLHGTLDVPRVPDAAPA